MLYIVSTPIGHLRDITARALEVLSSVDYILCEDTRHSLGLLQKYNIKKPLVAFHKFNERQAQETVLSDLCLGKHIALISDAGTPCINDPGLSLVQACIEADLPFTGVPGPCSLIQALLLSGFDSSRFQFIGFFPKKGGKAFLQTLLYYPGTSIGFESPERLVKTLQAIGALDPERHVAVAREMTKTFEECRRGGVLSLASHFEKHPPKGEIVLLVEEGKAPEEPLELEELIKLLQELHGLSLKEAIKFAAKLTNEKKSSIYKEVHKTK